DYYCQLWDSWSDHYIF
nr:immunoglobulin light chain junction region [Macaca mulatta]MOW56949.1 immunoglobulin light chain junction region [Macaca mulatta]MOW57782.1 immunoglobulin light chain junction region [Macaca mulatta]MOW58062.1 immunoglobulin light chain junction region [Macaca mulatta]MOW59354.1 immunoglobulin light chain junction region [Macaca mulatta]